MGYKAKRFAPWKVELSHGYWVEVRRLTKGEDDECTLALLGGELEGPLDSAQLRAKFHQREHSDLQLSKAIVRWNLDDDEGNVLPITLETVQGLADGDASVILAAIRGVNRPLEDPAVRQD